MSMKRFIPALITLNSAWLLGACASTGDRYPSLAIRDVERVEGSFDAPGETQQITPTPLPADTLQRIAQLRAEAADAHEAFVAMVPATRNALAAAQGTSRDSNAYASAQIAYADLESARSRAALALGEIDVIYIDATLAFAEREAITEARTLVAAMINEEDRTLAALQ